jgi:AGCS family alanine or glycine:cation symporter
MTSVINFLNTVFWGYVLIYGLLAVGIFFTIRLKFLQFVHFGEFFRSVRASNSADKSGITPFQALCTSLASRVGTGNIAGVAVALYLGGPGAIFWMWMVALVGMATAYAESTLAQLYKVKNDEGQYRGGPAFYIARGLGASWAGAIFSVCLILAFGLVFNAVQANSIADAMEGAFGLPKLATGIAVAAISGVVIFGGIKQIAKVAEIVVPFMAIVYLLMAIYVLFVHVADSASAKPPPDSPEGWPPPCSTASSAASSPTRRAWALRPTSRRSPRPIRTIRPRKGSCRRWACSSTRS